jgi:hypothetical protein
MAAASCSGVVWRRNAVVFRRGSSVGQGASETSAKWVSVTEAKHATTGNCHVVWPTGLPSVGPFSMASRSATAVAASTAAAGSGTGC